MIIQLVVDADVPVVVAVLPRRADSKVDLFCWWIGFVGDFSGDDSPTKHSLSSLDLVSSLELPESSFISSSSFSSFLTWSLAVSVSSSSSSAPSSWGILALTSFVLTSVLDDTIAVPLLGVPVPSAGLAMTVAVGVGVAVDVAPAGAGPQALQCKKPYFTRRRLCLKP